MNKLRCLIVDDEPVARKIIREFVGQVNDLVVVGEFENTFKTEAFLKYEQADLMFLDIEMPKLSGVGWLKKTAKKPMIILTTAFTKYAVEGYELDIIDYLVKPISFSRFLKAVQKAKEFSSAKNNNRALHLSWLFVRSDKRIEKIELDDIMYIESLGNYINIHTKDKSIVAYLTLKAFEIQLPASGFFKIHQSFVINLAKMEAIEGATVQLNNKLLPVSRSYRDSFMKMIEQRLVKR